MRHLGKNVAFAFSVTELHVRSYSVHKLRKLFAYFCSLSNGMEMASVNIVSSIINTYNSIIFFNSHFNILYSKAMIMFIGFRRNKLSFSQTTWFCFVFFYNNT